MSGTTPSPTPLTAELREQLRAAHGGNPALCSAVTCLVLESPTGLPSSEQSLIDLRSSVLPADRSTSSTAENAAVRNASLISTAPWDNVISTDSSPTQNPEPESEPQQFYTAHTNIIHDSDHLLHESDQSLLAVVAAHVQAASVNPQIDMLPRLRVLFEQLDVGDQQLAVDTRHASFSTETAAKQYKVLGATHTRTETECALVIGDLRIAILFVPWKDQALLINNSSGLLRLTGRPDKLKGLDIRPKRYETLDPGSWVLQSNSTCLWLQLRPCRYDLLLEEHTKKRTARAVSSSSKAARLSVDHQRSSTRASIADLHSDPEDAAKSLIWKAVAHEIDDLANLGIPLGRALHILDHTTAAVEYSIRRLDGWLVTRSHGLIFKAVWCRTAQQSRVVIVKMHKPAAGDENSVRNAVDRWKREVKMHRGLQHPCIASLVAFDARLLVLLVELKNAHDLGSLQWCYPRNSSRASHFKGTIDDAYTICADMASALSYLQDKDIIHDDIKALNILYHRQNGATLIDFGLSHFVSEGITQTGGSPWYKEPATQLTNQNETILGDIFSLGVVMLYLMGEISLPDQQPGWSIRDAILYKPEAVASQRAWFEMLEIKRQAFEMPPPGRASTKEAKLRDLVSKMLLPRSERISARDLARKLGSEQGRSASGESNYGPQRRLEYGLAD
ncbi:hypothetical protein M406DRAFT_75480 [Cryphonectria parasitica EP155]|uniref:Protein kinase domain-containing protein n=1 Tax=Cryphonectria parasitica (strain ATCC 38755 / EP155) TaxID=660469 RepID=A0A9P4Y832_CRYP1|nr:uncharacterized protein M406DRAFT_75480 [Cryphonectria parasitica EP155]KAF3768263.1 hypothetical protein M406DRAFT_75480 [Cryphonectria parasitica EP155]